MSWTLQRPTTHEDPCPWPSAEPRVDADALTIAVEWTGTPEKVWTSEDVSALQRLAAALDATVVHWGGLPEPKRSDYVDDVAARREKAVLEVVKAQAEAGDELAQAALARREAARE